MPIKRIGQDFIVNSTTMDGQINPSITTLADGRIAIVWSSRDAGDGSESCIRGRIYNAAGTAFGGDFIVNTTATNRQDVPSVTALTDGRFVVTWQSADLGDGSETCIRGRIYKADGTAPGDDFIVNTTGAAYQFEPAVTALPGGRFVVAWGSEDAGDGSGGCVRARIFSADGSPAGNDFTVESTTTGYPGDPSMTALADGRFVVAWASDESGDGDGNCIRARVYHADGSPAGDDFIVNATSPGGQHAPSIAELADGGFVVTWHSADPGDGAPSCIRGRRYGADGSAAGDDFIVNSTGTNEQYVPAVTALADGRFVATWQSRDPGDGSGFCIRARLFNADGSPASDDFIVNTVATNNQVHPSVTASADGHFVVTWYSADPGDGSSNCIRAQIFDPTVFIGTAGADTWQGGSLFDSIEGGAGDDTLGGGGDGDVIDGGSGNDVLSGGTGGDALTGGADADTVSYASSSAAVTVNLAAGTGTGGDAENDRIFEIENLLGSKFADTLIGDAGNNVLDGGAGDDTAVFTHSLDQYVLTDLGNRITVAGPDGTDTLISIEHLRFADGTINAADDGNPLFDTLYYLNNNPDVFHAGVNALQHFETFGWHEGRDPNAWFDTSGYLAVNTDVAAAGVNPLAHYHQSGWHEGRDPSASFDTTLYLIHNPDVATAGMDPLAHYLQFGMMEGRQAYQAVGQTVRGFDAQYYLFHNPDVAAAGVDPLWHFSAVGWKEGRNPNGWFDTAGYLAHYTDVAAAGINPLVHYEVVGWTEGRDPSAGFDTLNYLAVYTDVAAAGTSPLDHFLRFGIYEGRDSYGDGVWH
jgi:hypothetical protein